MEVIRRIGGLEKLIQHHNQIELVIRRIGGLEKNLRRRSTQSIRYPPHRRLRNMESITRNEGKGYPPHRRLRNARVPRVFSVARYPPHRRLRKYVCRMLYFSVSLPAA